MMYILENLKIVGDIVLQSFGGTVQFDQTVHRVTVIKHNMEIFNYSDTEDLWVALDARAEIARTDDQDNYVIKVPGGNGLRLGSCKCFTHIGSGSGSFGVSQGFIS